MEKKRHRMTNEERLGHLRHELWSVERQLIDAENEPDQRLSGWELYTAIVARNSARALVATLYELLPGERRRLTDEQLMAEDFPKEISAALQAHAGQQGTSFYAPR